LVAGPRRVVAKPLRTSAELTRTKMEDGQEVVTLASGVQFLDTRVGGGSVPEVGDFVLAHVKGYLAVDGDPVFLDTRADAAPIAFSLGSRPEGVTEGLEQAIATMRAGSIRVVQVPAYLGYNQGVAPVAVKRPLLRPLPTRTPLRYEVELLRCVSPPKEAESSKRLCCSDPAFPCQLGANPGGSQGTS
ncbi:unnamed protein product, partial [Polarella glacialis]